MSVALFSKSLTESTFGTLDQMTGSSARYALGNVENGTNLFMYGLTLRFYLQWSMGGEGFVVGGFPYYLPFRVSSGLFIEFSLPIPVNEYISLPFDDRWGLEFGRPGSAGGVSVPWHLTAK